MATTSGDTTWGIVTTFLGPARDVLQFAAYHLEAGAHRLYIYLDDPEADVYATLKAHPKVRVARCDAAHWKKLIGKRPEKHQVRQTFNATHAYNRKQEVDWLAHIDVDEFLVSAAPISDQLSALSADVFCARVRPMEQLSGDGTAFKAFLTPGSSREALVAQLYPTYGPYLKGGFLSHVAGKLFVRTGADDIHFRIHNVYQGAVMNPGETEMPLVDLAHCHAKTWEDWQASYGYRLEAGSYRAELPPVNAGGAARMTMHELFRTIEAEGGHAALRAFYDEVMADSPDLRARLQAAGALRLVDLGLSATLARHFPQNA